MERFPRRASVVFDCSSQGNLTNNHLICSPNCPDIDFIDVFGGPPRRASIQGIMYSSGENNVGSYGFASTSGHRHRWSGLSENPVFGDDSANRRRYLSHDFFDDIFKGNESLSSSLRKNDRDSFTSNLGSGVLSSNRPLPPMAAQPFSSSSVPAQFSLPAKLIKGTDLPIFGSSTRIHHKEDGISNLSFYAYSPLSRSPNQADHFQEDISFQSSTFQEISVSKDESSCQAKTDEMDKGNKLRKDSNPSEVPGNSSHFHFSVYKWASKSIPLALPRRGRNGSKLKEKTKLEKSSSASGRIACEGMAKKLLTVTTKDTDFLSMSNSIYLDANFSEIELDRKEDDSLLFTSTNRSKVEHGLTVEQAVLRELEHENQNTHQETVENNHGNVNFDDSEKERQKRCVFVTRNSGKTEDQIPVATREASKITLQSLLLGTEMTTNENDLQESKGKTTERSTAVYNARDKVKKEDGKRATLNSKEMDKENRKDSPKNSQDGLVKNRARGRVREFVKLFNQETSDKPRLNIDSESQSSRWKETGKFKSKDDSYLTTTMSGKTDEKVHLPNGNKNQNPAASIRADEFLEKIEKQQEFLEQIEKQHFETMANNYKEADVSPGLEDGSAASCAASIPDSSGENDSLQCNILIKEQPQDEDDLPQASDKQEDFQAIDAKIRKWSSGKDGNIRSLLSTLQYVLWDESGWKSVPLVDVIEANAVKRSYQKALLSLHPDKLQQKSATSQQKYLAEKVFDILQEAWTDFSSLSSV